MENEYKASPNINESIYMFSQGIFILKPGTIQTMIYIETSNQQKTIKKATGCTEYFRIAK